MRPDLTNGKGTGTSPVLGINRGGSFVQHKLFGVPTPFCRSRVLSRSPRPRISLSDTDDPSQSYLNSQCCCGLGRCYGPGFIFAPGTSTCHRYCPPPPHPPPPPPSHPTLPPKSISNGRTEEEIWGLLTSGS